MRKKVRGLVLLALAATVGAIAWHYLGDYFDPDRPHFTVRITPLRSLEGTAGAARRFDGAGMYWLDNQRLLAVADVPPPDARAGRYVEPVRKSLYLWDTQADSFTEYRELPLHDFSELCQARGRVWYRSGLTPEGDYATYWAGEFGSESQIRMPMHMAKADYLSGDRFLNTLSCTVQSRRETLRSEHREPGSKASVVMLRQQDGYVFLSDPLDSLHRDDSGFAELYRADGSPPLTLPIHASRFGGAGVDFSEYAGQYVITPKGTPGEVYLLKPDGTVTREDFPQRLKLAANALFPTRSGYFLPAGPVPDPGHDAGAWLYKNGKLYKLYDHVTDAVAVSPDGCKLAVDVSGDPRVAAGLIRIIDLCSARS